jgi:hydrogenase large subunit
LAQVKIDPVNRIEGHLGVEVDYSTTTSAVTDVKAIATMYRGFENILYKRPVQDAIQIIPRI